MNHNLDSLANGQCTYYTDKEVIAILIKFKKYNEPLYNKDILCNLVPKLQLKTKKLLIK